MGLLFAPDLHPLTYGKSRIWHVLIIKNWFIQNNYYLPPIFETYPTSNEIRKYFIFMNFYHQVKYEHILNLPRVSYIVKLLKLNFNNSNAINSKLGWEYYRHEFFNYSIVRTQFILFLYENAELYRQKAKDTFLRCGLDTKNIWSDDFIAINHIFNREFINIPVDTLIEAFIGYLPDHALELISQDKVMNMTHKIK